jgi:predicted RNase H-like HicB family nuclease
MIIQWSEEDRVYVVTLPEFPRCQTHGSTYEEAAKNGREVLELLIETSQADGEPLPKAMTLQNSPDFWGLAEAYCKTPPTLRNATKKPRRKKVTGEAGKLAR